jgi:predicted transcriptional regulator
MKKVLLNDTAQRMYVEDLMTFEAIATELDVSERTVRNWATAGRWDEKRHKFRQFQENLHDDARDIAALLAQKIKNQLENGQEPANHLLFSYTKIASSLIKIREYDKNIAAEAGNTDESEKAKKNAAEIFKQTFGVDLPDSL